MKEALGIIETRGKVALVTAVDTALKAANVSLLATKLVGGGLVNATVTGDVGSVRAATLAAEAAIRALAASGQTWVIARPAPDVWGMLEEKGKRPVVVRQTPQAPAIRREADAPALRPEAAPPALRPEAGLPATVVTPPPPDTPQKEPKARGKKPRKSGGKK